MTELVQESGIGARFSRAMSVARRLVDCAPALVWLGWMLWATYLLFWNFDRSKAGELRCLGVGASVALLGIVFWWKRSSAVAMAFVAAIAFWAAVLSSNTFTRFILLMGGKLALLAILSVTCLVVAAVRREVSNVRASALLGLAVLLALGGSPVRELRGVGALLAMTSVLSVVVLMLDGQCVRGAGSNERDRFGGALGCPGANASEVPHFEGDSVLVDR